MLRCAVALVLRKTIARILVVERGHQLIPLDLSNDTRSRHAQAVRIRLRKRVLREINPGQTQVINQQRIDTIAQLAHRSTHRQARRRYDAPQIDLRRLSPAYSNCDGHVHDHGQKRLSANRA